MFFNGITICHAGNIIANRSLESALIDELLCWCWQHQGFRPIAVEQIRDQPFSFDLHPHYPIMPVEILIEEILQFPITPLYLFTVTNDVVFELLDIQSGLC